MRAVARLQGVCSDGGKIFAGRSRMAGGMLCQAFEEYGIAGGFLNQVIIKHRSFHPLTHLPAKHLTNISIEAHPPTAGDLDKIKDNPGWDEDPTVHAGPFISKFYSYFGRNNHEFLGRKLARELMDRN